MILEALQYAATRAVTPKEFRPHIRYSVNLWARANRCAKARRSMKTTAGNSCCNRPES